MALLLPVAGLSHAVLVDGTGSPGVSDANAVPGALSGSMVWAGGGTAPASGDFRGILPPPSTCHPEPCLPAFAPPNKPRNCLPKQGTTTATGLGTGYWNGSMRINFPLIQASER